MNVELNRQGRGEGKRKGSRGERKERGKEGDGSVEFNVGSMSGNCQVNVGLIVGSMSG